MNDLNLKVTQREDTELSVGRELGPELLAQATYLLDQFPRLIGRLAAQSMNRSEPVLLGLLDGGVTIDGLLEAVEMHGDIDAEVEKSGAENRPLAILGTEDGWKPAVL